MGGNISTDSNINGTSPTVYICSLRKSHQLYLDEGISSFSYVLPKILNYFINYFIL